MIVIEIAGGILLAVLILTFLPWILVGLKYVLGAAVLIAVVGVLIGIGAQSDEAHAAVLIIGPVLSALTLPWLGWYPFQASIMFAVLVDQI